MNNNNQAMKVFLFLTLSIVFVISFYEMNRIEKRKKELEVSRCTEFLSVRMKLSYKLSKRKCKQFTNDSFKWKEKALNFLQE